MKTLAIIPARGASKGIPRKNMAMLNGKPLIYWTIAAAQLSHIEHIVVSSDDNDILSYANTFPGIAALRRPAHLATDTATTDSVMLHVLEQVDPSGPIGDLFDVVVLLQPTSPIRPHGLIDACVDKLKRTGVDSLLTLTKARAFYWHLPVDEPDHCTPHNTCLDERCRRQDMPPSQILHGENGSVYVTKADVLRSTYRRLVDDVGFVMMEPEHSIEIDTPYDLWLAEQHMQTQSVTPEATQIVVQ